MGNSSNDRAIQAAQEFQENEKGGADTDRQFSKAAHQARNDYQTAGEPNGPLSNRDIDTKTDVPNANKSSSDADDKSTSQSD